MISAKELQYVNHWESKAPYPGDNYAKKTLEEMQKMYEVYNSELRDKSFSIIFSDASECEFEIFESNLCHLLGVNYKWLTDGAYNRVLQDVLRLNPDNKISSYALLTSILENQDNVIAYDREASLRILNYYKALIKSSIFKQVGELEKFNFGMIKKDDVAKSLYMPSSEYVCPYFWVLIDKNEEFSSKYFVKSLLAPSRTELSEYLKKSNGNPVITTQIIVDDTKNSLRKTEATPDDKLKMLQMHDTISQLTGLPFSVDIGCDYAAVLMENAKLQEQVAQYRKKLTGKR